MNKNIPTLALLCTLALFACSRHDEPTSPEASNQTPSASSGDAPQEGEQKEKAPEIHLTAEAVQSNGVQIAQASERQLVHAIQVPTRVAFNAEATAHVGSPVRGWVAEWKVRVGDTVKKGDPLVVINSPELGETQANYLQQIATAQSAVASVELAKTIWERSQGVFEKTRGITLTQVQQREAEYKTAMMARQIADAAVVATERKLRLLGMSQTQLAALLTSGELSPNHTLIAPLDGTVIARNATLGEMISPDRESLLVVSDLSQLWALAQVPEAQLGDVVVGAKAWVRLRQGESVKETGVVSFIDSEVDEDTRTVKARIVLKHSKLKANAFVVAQIELPGKSGPVLAIPGEAVQMMEGKPVIFVPVKNEVNTFASRRVTLGPPVGGDFPVLSGLALGEEFVVSGSFILKADLLKSSATEED